MSTQSTTESTGLPSPPGTPANKPVNPYTIGASFTIKRHKPPAPYGGIYSRNPTPVLQEDVDQFEWCLSHQPATGLTSEDDDCTFTIADTIRTGNKCGAQLLLTSSGVVAKVYDPLYYEFHDCDMASWLLDVAAIADSDYSIEAAAYSELEGHNLQGKSVPKYYGSWTTNITHLTADGSVTREVRLILLEYIPGVCMIDIDPTSLRQEEKENIMRKLIEADYDIRWAGVRHEDLSPRNVIISSTTDYADYNMRLTIVDYASSIVSRIFWGKPPLWCRHNPLFEWASPSLWATWGWMPFDDDECIRWSWSLWGNGEEGRFIKVVRDPDHPLGHPIEPDDATIEAERAATP
jgi:hypothetical protein